MFFNEFNLEDIVQIINNALRGLCGWLCEMIYPGIAQLYEVFLELGKLVHSDGFDVVYNKISLLIGIFMVFRLTFWLIEALVNPSKLSDKENNPGKIIQKVLISVMLLAFTPTIFEYAFDFQNKIMESHMIEKIISTGNEVDIVKTGNLLSAELFINFYTPTMVNDGNNNQVEIFELVDDSCNIYTGEDGIFYNSLKDNGELNNLTNNCLTKKTDEITYENSGDEVFLINFNGLFATAVGIFVFWMVLMYCISLGTRYVQLIYLQVIAPIPIMCYLAPGKDNMFDKWVKQCTITYLDLFIRVVIINFVMLLCNLLLSNNGNFFSNIYNDNWLIQTFLVLGLLTFAKKAPELIQDLLPKGLAKASGDFGLSLKKRTESMLGGKMVYGASRAMTYGAVGAAATGAVGFLGGRGAGRITGLFGGMARGLASGAKTGSPMKNLTSGINKQNQINKRNIEWAKNGSTFGGRMMQRLANFTGTVAPAERFENEISEKDDLITKYQNGISTSKRKINAYNQVSSLKGNIESRAQKKLTEKERPSDAILATYYDKVGEKQAYLDALQSIQLPKNASQSDVDALSKKIAVARADYLQTLKENQALYVNRVMELWHARNNGSSDKAADGVMESMLNQLTSLVENDTDGAFADGDVNARKNVFVSANSDWDSIDKLEGSTTSATQDINYNQKIVLDDGEEIAGGIANVERKIKTLEDEKKAIKTSDAYESASGDRNAVGGHKGGSK